LAGYAEEIAAKVQRSGNEHYYKDKKEGVVKGHKHLHCKQKTGG